MATTIRCPGCGRVVDVTGPVGTKHEVVQGRDADMTRFVEILVGRSSVHRCVECVDGVFR